MGIKLQKLARRFELEKKNEQIEKICRDFSMLSGLGMYDSQVYIALLKIDDFAEACRIVSVSRTPHAKIYDALYSLKNIGFVEKSSENITPANRTRSMIAFKAYPFNTVADMIIREYEDELLNDEKQGEVIISYFNSASRSVTHMNEMLMAYGLNDYQSKVYTKLNINGKTKATDIPQGIISPSKIYSTLRELEEKDFVLGKKESFNGNDKLSVWVYEAKPIEHVVKRILEKQRNDINASIPIRDRISSELDRISLNDFGI